MRALLVAMDECCGSLQGALAHLLGQGVKCLCGWLCFRVSVSASLCFCLCVALRFCGSAFLCPSVHRNGTETTVKRWSSRDDLLLDYDFELAVRTFGAHACSRRRAYLGR
jgi:hypothetical protein